MFTDAQVRELLALMDRSKPTARRNIETIYLARLGADILDYYLELYPVSELAARRADYVYSAIAFARDGPRAVQLAQLALTDRAASVRYWAIGLLAATLDRQYVALLQRHAIDKPQDAAAATKAVHAIERQDQSYFMSSGHPAESIATIVWQTPKPDTTRHLDIQAFKATVELYFEKYSPEVVPELQRILGPLYK